MLFSLGRQIVYERETRTRKPTPKSDTKKQEAASTWWNQEPPFNTKQFEEALKIFKDKKSPGPDKITNEILEHLGTKEKSKLLGIFNNGWKTGHVPQTQSWREANMVPFHKKGKDLADTDSYRPFSLTSCVGKLNERLINTRLVGHLEKNNIIPEQSGFWQHRSTEIQVMYIALKIEDGFQDKQHTMTVWIDKVWKDGLCLKLQKVV